MYLYLKCNVKRGIQNTKFKVINQHKNDMCHVQSLEKDFYLSAPNSFDYVFTQIQRNWILFIRRKFLSSIGIKGFDVVVKKLY